MIIRDQAARVLHPASSAEALRLLQLAEYAGRNCCRSQEKITEGSWEGFLARLVRNGHESPLEFMDIAVELITSRDVMAELTRHRLASFAIQSQRYVDEDADGDGIAFIRPRFLDDGGETNWGAAEVWRQAMEDAERAYRAMRKAGARKEDARKVLPNSVATVIVMKANLREWRHILDLRTSPAAYPEMRALMEELRWQMEHVVPGWLLEVRK